MTCQTKHSFPHSHARLPSYYLVDYFNSSYFMSFFFITFNSSIKAEFLSVTYLVKAEQQLGSFHKKKLVPSNPQREPGKVVFHYQQTLRNLLYSMAQSIMAFLFLLLRLAFLPRGNPFV